MWIFFCKTKSQILTIKFQSWAVWFDKKSIKEKTIKKQTMLGGWSHMKRNFHVWFLEGEKLVKVYLSNSQVFAKFVKRCIKTDACPVLQDQKKQLFSVSITPSKRRL